MEGLEFGFKSEQGRMEVLEVVKDVMQGAVEAGKADCPEIASLIQFLPRIINLPVGESIKVVGDQAKALQAILMVLATPTDPEELEAFKKKIQEAIEQARAEGKI